METTAPEFIRNASRILAAAERGERVTVTRNGRPVAVLTPVGDKRDVALCPTGPMGEDDEAPVFRGGTAVDRSAGREGCLEGFGA
ncbi:type II toxin-antitoxin system Phd/YefM family antitoxin [Streptomyces sp. HPF1205]|uniref:type II toxin-antitoxin system Phd/YefM family antitoxin n=1 Tax=Streptomyces sp. HPF1205 TaxID=2873262 RepID=UPI001CEC72DE|nr:type II toxin-antitoxin system prevent-host-death family antitoxin [Streptomyces sp. HPF1205]